MQIATLILSLNTKCIAFTVIYKIKEIYIVWGVRKQQYQNLKSVLVMKNPHYQPVNVSSSQESNAQI
jgi:hypothetical protein